MEVSSVKIPGIPIDRTALHRACADGHDQVVAYLISQGAAVEVEADGDRFMWKIWGMTWDLDGGMAD
jgi:ankyrin repeat protein